MQSLPPAMTDKPRNAGMAAGFTLLAVVILCTALAGGVGALVGAPMPFVLGGLFIGFGAGFALVYSRFKDL